jgi:hypothetical protein
MVGLSIGEDHGLADKLGMGLLELADDRGRTNLHNWHGLIPNLSLSGWVACLWKVRKS